MGGGAVTTPAPESPFITHAYLGASARLEWTATREQAGSSCFFSVNGFVSLFVSASVCFCRCAALRLGRGALDGLK